MSIAVSSLAILVLAGVMNACFALPMKFTRPWAWENTWFAWTLFALLALPLLVARGTIPHLGDLYRSTSSGILLEEIGLGAGWGVAQVFFGLAVDAIGIALTFSLVLGTSAAVGALIPLVRLHPERLNASAGHGVLAGVGLFLLGVLLCAIAGKQREEALSIRGADQKNITVGLLLAILSGFGASFLNIGLAFGVPLAASAPKFGASTFSAPNAVWLPLLAAGAVPNIAVLSVAACQKPHCGKVSGWGARALESGGCDGRVLVRERIIVWVCDR